MERERFALKTSSISSSQKVRSLVLQSNRRPTYSRLACCRGFVDADSARVSPPASQDAGLENGGGRPESSFRTRSGSREAIGYSGGHWGGWHLSLLPRRFPADELPCQDLLSQVTGIRDAATESEMVVRDITRDIQSLDLAKRNLIASMNALKRFQMLGEWTASSVAFLCSEMLTLL